MKDLIMTLIAGGLISVIGIINIRGNISTLHWYHRQRVSEEDRVPFGRLVGSGTLIVGIALMVSALLNFASEKMELNLLNTIGIVVMIVGIVGGLGISFFAMLKYNKGIF